MTYHWKALDEGYKIFLDLIIIEGLHAKLWAPKVIGVPVVGISRLLDSHLGVSEQNAIWMWPPWRDTKNNMRGRWCFPQVWAVVNLVSSRLPVVCPSTKNAQIMHQSTCCWFV
jgi:hypothetical protein